MGVLVRESLALTLEGLSERLLCAGELPEEERIEVASWIAGRQGAPGGYRGALPAPTDRDRREARLFTGEKLGSWARTAHVLGEEACRALLLLGVKVAEVQSALETAGEVMGRSLRETETSSYWESRPGEYCCGLCTVSVWRHLLAGGLSEIDGDRWLDEGLGSLQRMRVGDGSWRRYPFYYTLSALAEMEQSAALDEIRYAAPRIERVLRRQRDDCRGRRRRLVAVRALARI
jgi:hypothetical protein